MFQRSDPRERGNVDRDGANGGPKGKKRQKKAVQEEPPQDAKVRINSVTSPETVLIVYFQENQESTPPPPRPAKPKSNPTVTPSSMSRKSPVLSSASSFARHNYGHSLANEEKPMSMAEIIRRGNSDAIRDQILLVVHEGLTFCSQEDRTIACTKEDTSTPPA